MHVYTCTSGQIGIHTDKYTCKKVQLVHTQAGVSGSNQSARLKVVPMLSTSMHFNRTSERESNLFSPCASSLKKGLEATLVLSVSTSSTRPTGGNRYKNNCHILSADLSNVV